tara:strand:- start:2277 stop:2501 length:225 start_codon:yes stop_codon:yes gene_type:complete
VKYNKEAKLIVLTNYNDLLHRFVTIEKRTRNGVVCSPILLDGKYCLPLGWEAELDKENIEFTIEVIQWYEEELI